MNLKYKVQPKRFVKVLSISTYIFIGIFFLTIYVLRFSDLSTAHRLIAGLFLIVVELFAVLQIIKWSYLARKGYMEIIDKGVVIHWVNNGELIKWNQIKKIERKRGYLKKGYRDVNFLKLYFDKSVKFSLFSLIRILMQGVLLKRNFRLEMGIFNNLTIEMVNYMKAKRSKYE